MLSQYNMAFQLRRRVFHLTFDHRGIAVVSVGIVVVSLLDGLCVLVEHAINAFCVIHVNLSPEHATGTEHIHQGDHVWLLSLWIILMMFLLFLNCIRVFI